MLSNLGSMEQLFLRIAEAKFHFLKSILESYDNMGILSSCPDRPGVVVLRFPSGFKQEVLELLAGLAAILKKD